MSNGSQQEFHIALGPGDRAPGNTEHNPAPRFNPDFGLGAYALVHRGIADDSALPYLRASSLELRLDQGDEHGPPSCNLQRRLEHFREADEARVANDDVDRLGDLLYRQIARV